MIKRIDSDFGFIGGEAKLMLIPKLMVGLSIACLFAILDLYICNISVYLCGGLLAVRIFEGRALNGVAEGGRNNENQPA